MTLETFLEKYRLSPDEINKQALSILLKDKVINVHPQFRLQYALYDALSAEYDLIIRQIGDARQYELIEKQANEKTNI